MFTISDLSLLFDNLWGVVALGLILRGVKFLGFVDRCVMIVLAALCVCSVSVRWVVNLD